VIGKKEADNLERVGNKRANAFWMADFQDSDYTLPDISSDASTRHAFLELKYKTKR